jgi:cation diffusion facilitator family transporter
MDRRAKLNPAPLGAFLTSPYVVMAVVLAMYIVKVAFKLTIGHQLGSPMIEGDGWHNVADIFEACIVIATIWFSRRPPSDTYPLGRKNIESLFSVVIGLGLILMALRIAWESLAALVQIMSGTFLVTQIISGSLVWWAVGVTLGSSLLSLVVSRYQIVIGRKRGHDALVADGEETASDGRIEFATFLGVAGESLFHAAWIEYPFALLVAGLMVKTGWVIFDRGIGALLQRSLGFEHVEAICSITTRMYGIDDVAQVKLFRTGSKVVLILKVLTLASPSVRRLMKEAMAKHIAAYLHEQGYEEGDFFIRFDEPNKEFHRRALLVVREDSSARVTSVLEDATHVIICDVEHGHVTRATEHNVEGTGAQMINWLFLFLGSKRVRELVVHVDDETSGDTLKQFEKSVEIINGPSHSLRAYGL